MGQYNIAWIVFQLIVLIVVLTVVVIGFGFIVGLFVYGRKLKRSRSVGFLEEALNFGVNLSHRFIDEIKRIIHSKRYGNDWLDDHKIISMLRGITPDEFEDFIEQLFIRRGYRAKKTGGPNDGGIDIDMTKDGRRYIVQCKKFITSKVTPHDVRDFFGAMVGQHVDGRGIFITTNIFTLEAERFAEGKPIELIPGTELVHLVRESEMIEALTRMKNASHFPGLGVCPKCGKQLVRRTNKKDGSSFIGCTGFPDCHFTKPS